MVHTQAEVLKQEGRKTHVNRRIFSSKVKAGQEAAWKDDLGS